MSDIDGGLRKLFRDHLPQLHWTSIETGGTGQGVADSNYLAPGGREGWVEYKQTEGWTVTLRPEQVSWLDRRHRLGGRAWIAVRRRAKAGPRRGPPVDELHVFHAGLAREAKSGGLRHPEVAAAALVLRGGPSRWDWVAVLGLLLQEPSSSS